MPSAPPIDLLQANECIEFTTSVVNLANQPNAQVTLAVQLLVASEVFYDRVAFSYFNIIAKSLMQLAAFHRRRLADPSCDVNLIDAKLHSEVKTFIGVHNAQLAQPSQHPSKINDELAVMIVAFLLSIRDYDFITKLTDTPIDASIFRVSWLWDFPRQFFSSPFTCPCSS